MSTIERALEKQNASSAQAGKVETENALTNESSASSNTANIPPVPEAVASDDGVKYVSIDWDDLDAKGFVSVKNSRKLINEEYRAIKRKVLKNAFGPLAKTLNNANVIMVTSAKPSEGKTFTAVNLALSIALEQDKTVLLVDADVLKPNVMPTLGLENQEGLMEYLLGEKSDVSEVMLKTELDKLRIIAAGRSHHLSAELLASENMIKTVNEFSSRYPDRVVIVDTPPLLGINETAILANLAGQAVIVVEESGSKLRDIKQATEQLNPDMAKGFVVNKSIHTQNDKYYGYYYSDKKQG